jgi:hypothetical protein
MNGIDLNKVYHSDAPAVIRLTALELSKAPSYTKPGEWLARLPLIDLQYLIMLLDQVNDLPDNPYSQAMILLAMILAQAEGVDSESANATYKHVHTLQTFLILESLHRKGVTEVIHANMSFGDDAGNLTISKGVSP